MLPNYKYEDADDDLEEPHDYRTLYLEQCRTTDEWAAKYQAAKELVADTTLKARIDELERSLASMNAKFVQLNEGQVKAVTTAKLNGRSEVIADLRRALTAGDVRHLFRAWELTDETPSTLYLRFVDSAILVLQREGKL